MDFERLKAKLHEFDALRKDDVIQSDSVDSIEPKYADSWPDGIHPNLRNELLKSGISAPYQHQAKAVELSLLGHDIVLESPTASGKTLAFTVPMLDSLLRNPNSHALMIYPMKALAFDQRTQLQEFCDPLGLEAWHYDGDTGNDRKKTMRQTPPDILLTNPEYLSMSFLAHSNLWTDFLQNLKFVVIDEMHEYRGFFGSNMALLLRRFFLKLDRLGAKPRVFLSTATCANPQEHAQRLTGRKVKAISAGMMLRPNRHFLFVKPVYRPIFQLRIENAAQTILECGLQALIFCPTKRFLEDAFRNCQRKAEEKGLDKSAFAAFHADLKHSTRQQIQQKIKSGELKVIFTTNALELGLDIGGLDGVVLAGFPPNIMSAWQQIGRAGRSCDSNAFVLFYAMNDPIDRFYVNNISAFLNRPFDHLVVDPENNQLIDNHIPSLVQETGGEIHEGDSHILGQAFYRAAKNNGGRPIKRYRPQRYLDLRGSVGNSYILKHENEELGQIPEIRRFREVYVGAIFTFFGRKYRVHAHEADAIQLVDTEQHLRTDATFFRPPPHHNQILEGVGCGKLQIFHGTLNLQMNFKGYKLIDERSDEELEDVHSHDAYYQNNLHATWFDDIAIDDKDTRPAIAALEHLFRVGAMFVIPADRFDTSTWSTAKDGHTVYYYENYQGGIGVARKFYDVWQDALAKGIEIASKCPCKTGCQNCIEPAKSWNMSNSDIDKRAGIKLARELINARKQGVSHNFQNGHMVSVSR